VSGTPLMLPMTVRDAS